MAKLRGALGSGHGVEAPWGIEHVAEVRLVMLEGKSREVAARAIERAPTLVVAEVSDVVTAHPVTLAAKRPPGLGSAQATAARCPLGSQTAVA
jgi:hypothetical protein